MPKSPLRALVVAVVTLLAALVPALLTTTTASAAPRTAATAASHSGLQCRSHKAETNGPSGRVNVPASYCYDPDTTTHPGWHDYCTSSPDDYSKADFRGPCARHDMCLQAGRGHGACDGPLLSDLKHNCGFAFGGFLQTPMRVECDGVAYTYYLVIKVKTHI